MPTTQQCESGHISADTQPRVSTKAVVVIMADPNAGTEEALGRVFNALATTYDFLQHGQRVEILFLGTGTRWIGELSKPDHPAHELFEEVKGAVAGVSCGCADVFDGRESAVQSGFDLITENEVPGTSGLPSLQKYISQGFTVLTF